MNILLVDDEDAVRTVTAEMLKRLGHTVKVCGDGLSALEAMGRGRAFYDLVFLDMIMPDFSGERTFHGLRELSPEAKIILISGYSVDDEAQALLGKGAAEFIQKPYSKGDLAAVIDRVAGSARAI